MPEILDFPFDNPDIIGIAPLMRTLQQERPISKVRREGEDAWLVTRYDDVRALLADLRLGLSDPKLEKATKSAARSHMVTTMTADGNEEHRRQHVLMRSLLVPRFSPRRMDLMKGRIEGHVDFLLDRLAASTPPADLHRALSFPLPTMVICDLLGVPLADHERIGHWARGTFDQRDDDSSTETYEQAIEYIAELVARKRAEPGDDILSELIAERDGTLSDLEIARLGNALLLFGFETTGVRIQLGTLLLMRNPDQRAKLVEDPGLAPAAAEEVLRLGVGGLGSNALIPRYALSDITVGDTVIHAGDAVMLAIGAANYDDVAFPDHDKFDVEREDPKAHLAFGRGIRLCVGRTLARMELIAVFERMFRKLPNLRLAVPEQSLRWDEKRITGGFDEIPVTF
jgi:pentalenolactone synthase